MDIKFYYNKNDFNKNDGVKLNNSRIQEMIDEVVKELKESYDYSFSATGDTIVFGFRWEDEISIYVCKNYEYAEAWINDENCWEKMDWLKDYDKEEREKEYKQFDSYSKEELIDMLIDGRNRPVYNPHREV